mmetsp:Transcript_7469/g.8480  ORF Transcript_7469/g.8480 Transcript_7469/m.8480 type:complete len:323 (+) Transcript_7469:246-1214(+)
MLPVLGRVVEVELLGASGSHDRVENSELSGRQGTDHHASSAQASEAQLPEPHLLGEVDQSAGNATGATSGLRLVDERQQCVGGVRNDRRGDTSDHARPKGHAHLQRFARRGGGCADSMVDLFRGRALHGELRHCVRHLLEEDGAEARIEALDETILSSNLGRSSEQATRELGVGNQANSCCLQGAQEHISDGLGHGGSGQVNARAVLPGRFIAHRIDHVDLEELHTTELEPALDEITRRGRAQTSRESANSIGLDHLTEAFDHPSVVLDRIKLDVGFHNIHRAQRRVSNTTADATSQCSLEVIGEVILRRLFVSGRSKNVRA